MNWEKLMLTSAQTGGDLEGNGMEGMKGYDFDGREKERERLERRERPPLPLLLSSPSQFPPPSFSQTVGQTISQTARNCRQIRI